MGANSRLGAYSNKYGIMCLLRLHVDREKSEDLRQNLLRLRT